MANPIVTALPEYVEQRKGELIAKAVLGAKTVGMINMQTDVKEKTAINLLNTDIAFGDGKACAFSASGDQTLTQRYIEPEFLKVNMEYCDKNLLGTYAGYQVKVAAGKEELPFEEKFINDVIAHVDEAVEKMVWQGDKATAAASGAIEFDGFLKVLSDPSASVVNVTFGTGSTAYDKVKDMYAAIPAEIISKEDTVIFTGEDDYREYVQDLVTANLYHYNPGDGANEYKIPGTATRVIAVPGLNGTHKMVAGQLSNMYYGTDMANDQEVFDFWYSKDNRIFRLAIEFCGGVQVAWPDQMVLGA